MRRLRPVLDRLIQRNRSLTSLYYVWDDWRTGHRYSRGDIATHSGTLHESLDLVESIQYVETVVADYLRYSGRPSLDGKAAEVGPGDNCGVALLLLEGGCQTVDLVDRFYSRRDSTRQADIYRELARRHPGVARILQAVDFANETTFPGLRRLYGEVASAESFFQEGQDYDVILSRAVLEHVRDPLLSLRRMATALSPTGLLLHKVDLRDHGMFSVHHGELTWLESPGWLHRRMSTGSGRPNRILFHQYRSALAMLPLDVELLVTRLAGVGEIEPHLAYASIPESLRARSLAFVASRSARFAAEFRRVDPADLSVTGFFLVGRKRI